MAKDVIVTLKINGQDKAIKSINELEEAVKDLDEQLKGAEFGSKQFQEIQAQLKAAKSEFKELDEQVDGMTVGDKFAEIAKAGGAIVGSFEIAKIAAESFGGSSEEASKRAETAAKALTVVLTTQEIAESKIIKTSIAKTAAYLKDVAATQLAALAERQKATATVAGTAATTGATVATRIFNAVLKANPIGLVVTAALALGAAIFGLIKFVQQFNIVGKVMGAVMDGLRDAASWLTGGLIDDAATAKTKDNAAAMIKALDDISNAQNVNLRNRQRELSYLEASGATEAQILAKKKEISQAEIKLAQDRIAALKALGDRATEEEKNRIKELNIAVVDARQQILNDQAAYDKKQADAAASAAKAASDKAKEAAKAAQQKQKEFLSQRLSLLQETALQEIKDEDDRAKAKLEQDRENAKTSVKEKQYSKEKEKELLALIDKKYDNLELERVKGVNDKIKEQEAAFAKELEALKDENALASIKNEDERALKEIEIQKQRDEEELQRRLANEELTQEQVNLLREELAQKYAQKEDDINAGVQQKKLDRQMTANQAIIEDETLTYEQRYQALSDQETLITQKTYESEEERTQALKDAAATRKAIEMAEFEAKMAITTAQLDLAAQAGQFLQQIAGKNKKLAIAGIVVEQAAAIGKIIANTAIANAKSVATFPITAGQPWVTINTISAALSIASTIAGAAKAIKEINAAGSEDGGGGGGGGSAPSGPKGGRGYALGGLLVGPSHAQGGIMSPFGELEGGEAVINKISTQQFAPLLSTINQAGGGVPIPTQNGEVKDSTPIFKTYVVATDVSNAQEANRKVDQIAKL